MTISKAPAVPRSGPRGDTRPSGGMARRSGGLARRWRGNPARTLLAVALGVMLVGLASKNSILIVEFAEQLRLRGLPVVEAAVEAARIRLRPILMTSFAFILGVVPLAVAHGAGQAGRHSVGTTVFGGMIASTLLNLFFIPVLYVLIEQARERRSAPASESAPSLAGE